MPPRKKARTNGPGRGASAASKSGTTTAKVTTVTTKTTTVAAVLAPLPGVATTVATATTTAAAPASATAADPPRATAQKRKLDLSARLAVRGTTGKRTVNAPRQSKRAKMMAEATKAAISSASFEADMPDVPEPAPPSVVGSAASKETNGAAPAAVEMDVEKELVVSKATEPDGMEALKTANDVPKDVVPKLPGASGYKEKPASGKTAPIRKRAPIRPVYDELWKEVHLAGTEWGQLETVYSIDWDFDHLDDDLTEGDLADKEVHLFGATEPQLLKRDEKDEKGEVIPVPVIVAVVSDVPPPSTVGINSVQRAEEEIVPMSAVRMEWLPYAPENVSVRRFKPKVHVLKCNERRARLRNMKEAAVHKYDYVLPYLLRPDQVDDVTINSVVQVLAELEGRSAPLMCEFDFEMDELDEFVEEQIEENELDESKHAEQLKTAIRDAVRATKQKYRAEKEERQKRIDAIPEKERNSIKNMRLLKYYPMNDWPDVSNIKSSYINRYYGKATKVL